MKTKKQHTAPAAKNAGTSKTLVARFPEEDGCTVYSVDLTPEILAKVRGAVKFAKKNDSIVRVKLSSNSVRIVAFDSLSAKAKKQLLELGFNDEEKVYESVIAEFDIPKRCLTDSQFSEQDEHEGIYVEVGSDACRGSECLAVLICCNNYRLDTYHVNFAALEDSILK